MNALIRDILAPSVSEETRLRLLEAANGNPLFALSLANHYRHAGDGCGNPSTLVELLSRRLDPVSNVALGVLATCIALGKHCTADRLIRAVGITPIALMDALAELAELGLVDVNSEHPSPAHPLIAEVVTTRLLPAMRSVVNLRVAEVLENDARSLRSPACWWDAGNRWRDAGEPERALAAFRECARHAVEIGRAADAARILSEALALPASERSMLEAAKEMVTAADLSSDTRLVLRGQSILAKGNTADEHDEFELAARRAVVRDSQLPDRVFEMTLRCLRATNATAEHRVLAATLGLKSIHVAQCTEVARLIVEQVSELDLNEVEDVIRLEFSLLAHATLNDWENSARTAEQLMHAAAGKRPARRLLIYHNCGIALILAGRPHAAIGALQEAFSAACLARSPSQQIRVASLVAGVYADLFDDENMDIWICRAAEASTRAGGPVEPFDLIVIQICRSFIRQTVVETEKLLSQERERGHFAGSPVRERWGKAFSLLADARAGTTSAAHERAARELVQTPNNVAPGLRDFEIAAAAANLAVRDKAGALQVIRNYLTSERVGPQLIDRFLAETMRELQTAVCATLP